MPRRPARQWCFLPGKNGIKFLGSRTEETQTELRLVELRICVVEDGQYTRGDTIENGGHNTIYEQQNHNVHIQEQAQDILEFSFERGGAGRMLPLPTIRTTRYPKTLRDSCGASELHGKTRRLVYVQIGTSPSVKIMDGVVGGGVAHENVICSLSFETFGRKVADLQATISQRPAPSFKTCGIQSRTYATENFLTRDFEALGNGMRSVR
ncbi:hypothetical protein K438DRAFT_1769901 [Mycena galopus ATCC 62051]|nr:hypothetical protein K438DRAFT_1769901 [Mycena galopus ATCC 62051]